MGDKVKRYPQVMSSQVTESQIAPKEYNELLHMIAKKNRIIDEIKFECGNGKTDVPVVKLKKILSSE